MIQLYAVLFGASILALISDRRTNLDDGKAPKKDIFFFLTAVLLICFIGLRTRMNDTASYIHKFEDITPFNNIDWQIGSNPMFFVIMSSIKQYITKSANAFIFITALFSVGVNVWFIKKHSVDFGYSIFLYITLGVYSFAAGAMKQTMATAVALLAVDLFLKKKRILSIIFLALAVLIHPYVIIYVSVPFLMDGVWNRKSLYILLCTFVVGLGFSFFLEKFVEFTDTIGEGYDAQILEDGQGTNILRVLVYMIIPLMSYFSREIIKKSDDKFLYLATNLSLLTCCFSIISLFGAGYALGRVARYIDVFQCFVLPYIVKKSVFNKQNKALILAISLICFAIYYYFSFKKYLVWGFNVDYYNRISLLDLIRGWNAC